VHLEFIQGPATTVRQRCEAELTKALGSNGGKRTHPLLDVLEGTRSIAY